MCFLWEVSSLLKNADSLINSNYSQIQNSIACISLPEWKTLLSPLYRAIHNGTREDQTGLSPSGRMTLGCVWWEQTREGLGMGLKNQRLIKYTKKNAVSIEAMLGRKWVWASLVNFVCLHFSLSALTFCPWHKDFYVWKGGCHNRKLLACVLNEPIHFVVYY